MLLKRDEYLSNIDGLIQLFENAFGRKIDPSFLKWRYVDNPTKEMFVNIFRESDRIIANYSASPCFLSINGCSQKSALSMTTMTDPEFAGRGLFQKLAEELYNEMQVQGYSAVWGFPNNQSHRTFASKLRWEEVYEIPTMSLRLGANNPANEKLQIVLDNAFSFKYSTTHSIKNLIHVEKDQLYLQWRYAHNPINQYSNIVIDQEQKVSSYCIVKKFNNELDIVDFQAANVEEGLELIKRAIQFARDHQLLTINCWAPRHHFMHGICERQGFVNATPITYLGIRSFGENNISCNYSDWFIQMGDSDVY